MENVQEVQFDRDMQGEIAELVELFPAVNPGAVPEEVWKAARDGQRLGLAYALYQLAALTAELKAVKDRQRSPGSVYSADSMNPAGTLASYWDAYQI